MFSTLFYRNIRAAEHLQLFLVSAASTVLVQRLFLYLTHYPQVGGGKLHIAHMLYGGLLMMAAIVMMVSFLGERIRHFSCFIGGIGFGLFIDELGKFITKDNDYFFRPTIGLIYAVFVIIFLSFNYLGRKQDRLTDLEYELNALNQFEEAILQDLDPKEKQHIIELLSKVSRPTHISQALDQMLRHVETVPEPKPRFVSLVLHAAGRSYTKFWQQSQAKWFIGIVFAGQAIVFSAAVAYGVYAHFNTAAGLGGNKDAYANHLLLAELVSSLVSVGFAIAGTIKLFSSRLKAYDLYRSSLLVNIFLTEFFIFTRVQFQALPSFAFNLLLLIALRIALYQEQQIKR